MSYIKLYFVYDTENGRPLTIVRSKKQVRQYIDTFVRARYYEHYNMWCNLRKLDSTDENSWKAYIDICQPDVAFIIKTGKVQLNTLLSGFRSSCGCIPLGMPWELDAEIAAYTEKLPKEIKDALKGLKNDATITEVKQAVENAIIITEEKDAD